MHLSRYLQILVWTTVVTVCLPAPAVGADVRLAGIFSDHMVLQRDSPVAVWGWADPGRQVTVRFGGQSRSGVADRDGAWSVRLDPMPASVSPNSPTPSSTPPVSTTTSEPGNSAPASPPPARWDGSIRWGRGTNA